MTLLTVMERNQIFGELNKSVIFILSSDKKQLGNASTCFTACNYVQIVMGESINTLLASFVPRFTYNSPKNLWNQLSLSLQQKKLSNKTQQEVAVNQIYKKKKNHSNIYRKKKEVNTRR